MDQLNLKEISKYKKIRFIFSGILNTLFGYSAYAVLLFFGFPYLVALLLATILGMIFNYFSFRKFVFSSRSDWLVFLNFFIVYITLYIFNVFGLWILTEDFFLNPYIGQIVCIPTSVLLSWLSMNYWVFKKE